MKFPKHFPVQCPPSDSTEGTGTFFRAVKANKPIKSDFKSYWLSKPHKRKEWLKNGQACEACGVSVNANIEDLKRKQNVLPSLRNMKIAKGTLQPHMGKIKATPSRQDESHHTWWIPNSIEDPSVFFKVVA